MSILRALALFWVLRQAFRLAKTLLTAMVLAAAEREAGATVFGYYVQDPERYGVVQFDAQGRVTDLLEKPKSPPSNYAVTGIYFYDGKVFDIVKKLKPSARNELEITDVNNAYIETGEMTSDTVKGFWADAGENIDFYLKACNTVAQHGANKDAK